MMRLAELAVGPAKQDRGIEPMRHRGQGRQLPVAEVACKDQGRFAVEPQLREQFVGARLNFDPAVLGAGGIMLPDMVEMSEFGAKTSEVIPDTCQDSLDFLR